MNINFNEAIKARIDVLHQRIEKLNQKSSSLELRGPYTFCIDEIDKTVNPRKKGAKVGCKQLNFLEQEKGAFVYIFEISFCRSRKELIHNLKAFRSKDNKDGDGNDMRRSTSKLPLTAEENKTSILYVGSIKEYLHNRIRQHLGFGHKHTFSIQLKHWAPVDLTLNLYIVNVSDKDLTNDIEAAIAYQLNPLIGKTEK